MRKRAQEDQQSAYKQVMNYVDRAEQFQLNAEDVARFIELTNWAPETILGVLERLVANSREGTATLEGVLDVVVSHWPAKNKLDGSGPHGEELQKEFMRGWKKFTELFGEVGQRAILKQINVQDALPLIQKTLKERRETKSQRELFQDFGIDPDDPLILVRSGSSMLPGQDSYYVAAPFYANPSSLPFSPGRPFLGERQSVRALVVGHLKGSVFEPLEVPKQKSVELYRLDWQPLSEANIPDETEQQIREAASPWMKEIREDVLQTAEPKEKSTIFTG